MPRLYAYALVLVCLLVPSLLFADAGDVDCSFGSGGFILAPALTGTQSASDLVIDPDDKIVVAAGEIIARYTASGSLDTTFGTGGHVAVPVSGGSAMRIKRDSSGRYVVAGYSPQVGGTRNDVWVARLNSDGTLDTTFANLGSLVFEFGGSGIHDYLGGLGIDSQGRIVVGGGNDWNYNYPSNGFGYSVFAVARFTPAGAFDTTFSGDGIWIESAVQEPDHVMAWLVVQPDDKILVSGREDFLYTTGQPVNSLMARLNTDGTLDTTFSGDGYVSWDAGNMGSGHQHDIAFRFVLDSAGRIVVGNISTTQASAVSRLNADGTLDTSFGGTGVVGITFDGQMGMGAITVGPDDKPLIGGNTYITTTSGGFKLQLVRLTTAGAYDTTFGGDGRVWSAFVYHNLAEAIGFQSDGRLIVAGRGAASTGTSGYDVLVARYVYDGPARSTTTTITSHSPDPSTVGQAVNVQWTVTSPAGTPTGTVTVSDGVSSCSAPVGDGGCTVTLTTAGNRTLTASFAGGGFCPSSATAAHTVGTPAPITTTTTITADTPDPSLVGQSVSVTVSVTAATGSASGTVTVNDGAGASCSAAVSGGTATCSLTPLVAGTRNLTASFSGTGFASSSDTEMHTINKIASTTTITAHTPEPSVPGQSVTVSVAVSSANGTPAGNVTISSGASSCVATLSSGAGSCSIAFSSVGSQTITAAYAGGTNWEASSATATHTVQKIATSTAITAHTPEPSHPGQPVSVSVTVSSASGTPNGAVTISSGASSCVATLSGGAASCSIAFGAAGSHTITAAYAGDATFDASSATATHVVQKIATTTAITAHTPEPSIPGQPVSVSVTVSSASGTPNGAVTITNGASSCVATLSGGTASCSITFAATGSHPFTATFAGDAVFDGSSASASHLVADVTAPVFTSINASTTVLWPPNHKMVPVTFTATATDDVDPSPVISIAGVTVTELDNGRGDGNTSGDWQIQGMTVLLRSERAGNGNGREYRVHLQARDASGNTTTQTVVIRAPKQK